MRNMQARKERLTLESSFKTSTRDPEKRNPQELPSKTSQEGRPLKFFLLVVAITIPFWIFGSQPLPIPVKLPVSALSAFNPLIAACLLSYQEGGWDAVKRLFKRAFDYKKITNKAWYLPTLFLSPLVSLLSYASLRWVGAPLPDPEIQLLMVPVFFIVFFIFAAGEELGWMGYAVDPLQDRFGALKASLLLGVVWALYHLIPDLQNQHAADWILWQRLGTVATRILIVWIYNNTGKSVFAAILFHAMHNLSWALFPNFGSHYDPFTTGLFLSLASLVVVAGWKSQTLARFRLARGLRS
jgi:uncharacterized protein